MKKILYILLAISLFHNFTAAQQGWFVQYGGPTSAFYRLHMLDSSNGWAVSYDSVFRTTNGGTNWNYNAVPTTLNEDVFFINVNTGWIISGNYIYKTTNNGNAWILQLTGSTQYRIRFVDENTGFVISTSNFCKKSTNGGANWISFSIGPGSIALFSIQFINHDTGWIGGANGNIYKTTNCGINWSQFNTGTSTRIYGMSFPTADSGWAGGFDNFGESKILFTSNGGLNWSVNYNDPVGQGVEDVFFTTANEGWAVGLPGKIMHTTNAGLNWEIQNSNAGNIHLFSVCFITPKLGWIAGVAGGANGKIIKTTTGGLVPMVQVSTQVPSNTKLHQNYPNPFNPVTKICFDIMTKSISSLSVYDMLGRQIANLVNRELIPGSYSVEFDAGQLPSGTYFYRLRSGNFAETKKMNVIK